MTACALSGQSQESKSMMKSRFNCWQYLALLMLFSGCGGGGGDVGPHPSTGSSAPPTPASVTAVGGPDSIEVSWTTSPNTRRYLLYWRDTPGVTTQNGTRTQVDRPPGIISGLDDDTVYYAIVVAENDVGQSGASAEVSAQPVLSLPGRVTGISVVPGDAAATLRWNSQVNADSYIVRATSLWRSADPVDSEASGSPFELDGLVNGVTYEMTVAAVNAAGEGSQSAPVEITPVAPVPGWTPQTKINRASWGIGTQLFLRDVAINGNGVAAAVWVTITSPHGYRYVGISHTAGGDWSEPLDITSFSNSASVAVTPGGDIHVAYDGDRENIYWQRYRNGVWSDPVEIQSSIDRVAHFGVELASDPEGNVFAAWVESDSGEWETSSANLEDLMVSRFDADSETWSDPELVSDSVSRVRFISIESGVANQAVIAWLQDTAPFVLDYEESHPRRPNVYASRYDGVAWQPGEVIGRNDLVDWDQVTQFSLDVDNTGSAIVVWSHEFDATHTFQLGATRYDATLDHWSAPEVVQNGGRQPGYPDIVVDASGQSLAAWHNGSNFNVLSSVYDSTAMLWGPIDELPTDYLHTGDESGIERGAAGAVVLAWTHDREPRGIFVRRLEPGSSEWSASDLVGGYVDGFPMLFESHSSGHAIIVVRTTVRENENWEDVVFASLYYPDP